MAKTAGRPRKETSEEFKEDVQIEIPIEDVGVDSAIEDVAVIEKTEKVEAVKIAEVVVEKTPAPVEEKIVDAEVVERKLCGIYTCQFKYGGGICKTCVEFKK